MSTKMPDGWQIRQHWLTGDQADAILFDCKSLTWCKRLVDTLTDDRDVGDCTYAVEPTGGWSQAEADPLAALLYAIALGHVTPLAALASVNRLIDRAVAERRPITDVLTNARLVRENLCAVCHGALVERYQDGVYVVVCAADPAHGGFVSQMTVKAQDNERRLRESEVLGFYAEMFGLPRPDTAQGRAALYGSEN